ncbi:MULTISPECIES: EAL domain-containing protein [unclassified Oceanispirochaeta]|uniref:EAL domain-containing protein n=1 Tax=unclassified Oceanispirochaeta TaxID=2635722 RepID=UPI000E09DF55|nr:MULTISPECIES: EAL domain-containing protein [unclassified Oceanispirochaeta]MBF9018771.1 GGDEF domain-containing protein [Oceanispirochaeta sp. M2]NPD75240.1 GGDEF domain-containing protein [Oceanispirochaeta sp. M1]RDG28903.1 GGDEF domain-containing protein [Oceanispirochaeta sp. M1]
MKLNDANSRIEYYFNIEDSEIILLRKKMVSIFVLLYISILFLGLVSGITGFQGIRSPNWKIHTSIRIIYICILFISLITVKKRKLEKLENILVFISISNILSNFIFGYSQFNILSLVGILVSSVFPIQLIHHFVKKLKLKIFLYMVVLFLFYSIGIYFIFMAPENQRESIPVILFISFFLYIMIIFPGLIDSNIRNKLDGIVVQKTLYDDQTGMKNQFMLIKDLADILTNSHKEEKNITVFGIHLMKFERIIEKKGYNFGNLLLKEIGLRLGNLEKDFHIYNISGVLFCLIPKYEYKRNEIEKIIHLINSVFSVSFKVEKEFIEVKYELIATESPEDGRSANRIISNLHNTALRLSSKSSNSQSINWFDHKTHELAERGFLLENDLNNMIKTSEFLLLIQPKVSLYDGKIHGGEFLSRWPHPILGQISPIEFIPLLEENNLMVDFTEAISNEVIRFCDDLHSKIKKVVTFAVNVNASTLQVDSFIKYLIHFSQKISPFILEVEITEDVFLKLDKNLTKNISILKDSNIHLALDDFGTGFSNMSYLQDLNVDTIKIDKIFISTLEFENNSYGIVKALIDMAHTFNIEIVAEGVETTDQRDILQDLGCDIIQGYLYHKPMEMDKFKALMINDR